MAKNQNDRAVIDLVINGQQSQASLKQISLEATRARSALLKMKEADDPAAYQQKLKEYQALANAQREMTTRINGTSSAWSRFKSNMASTALGLVGGNVIGAAFSAIGAGVSKAISSYREFNAASADMSANLGLTTEAVDYLNAKAKEMGPAVGKSAADVLEGFKLVGSANSDLVKTPDLLAQVTREAITLSQASKMSLADATASLVGSMNQFNAGADQASRFINVMAGGAQVGSAEIDDMAMALKASGIVANQTGLSFEQTNGALQSLSKESLKGEQAGTMLRNILLTLGAGADETNPRVVGLEKALENLARQNLSTAEMTKLFGKENVTAALSLINHRDRVLEFTKGLTGTSAAYDMAATNNATLDHQLELFWAKVDKLILSLSNGLVPAFTKLVAGGNQLITVLPQVGGWLAKNGEWLLITGIPALIAYNGTLIKATASAAANTIAEGYRRAAYQLGFQWLVISEAATKAYTLATGVLTGQISIQTAVVTVARNVWAVFSAVLLANPIGIVVGALGGLVAAMKYFSEHTERALDLERKKAALQQQGEKATKQSAQALQDLNQKVAQSNNLSQVEQENLKKTIALKYQEAKARLAAALAKAREIAREEAAPTFWQGVKQGATDFVTGNWGSLGGAGLEQRRRQQAEENKMAAYNEAKQKANVEQLKADMEQMNQLYQQVGQSSSSGGTGGGSGSGLTDEQKKKIAANQEARLAIEKMQMEAIADDRKRELAKAQYEADQEKERVRTSIADESLKAAQLKAIEARLAADKRAINAKYDDQKREQLEQEQKDIFEAGEKELAFKKRMAEYEIDLAVSSGKMTKEQGEQAKLNAENAYLTGRRMLVEAYYQKLAEQNQQSDKNTEKQNKEAAKRLKQIELDKQTALLEIQTQGAQNSAKYAELNQEKVEKALQDDLKDAEIKRQKALNDIQKKSQSGELTPQAAQNVEFEVERRFLAAKRKLHEDYYTILAKMGNLSAEQLKEIERAKSKDLTDIDAEMLKAQQAQYEGMLGGIKKYMDNIDQYVQQGADALKTLFEPNQKTLDVGPLLTELDKLQHKTNLTSSEQERMKDIIAQIGTAMPSVVTGTNEYGEAISINTQAATQEVEAQKKRAKVMHAIMVAQAAWSAAMATVEYGQAVMRIWATSVSPIAAIGETALLTGQYLATLVKIKSQTFSAPQFADGGFTGLGDGPAGFVSSPTLFSMGQRRYIAGEAGREFIISNKSLQNPVVANFARIMDAAQKTGNYSQLGAGSSSANLSGSAFGIGSATKQSLGITQEVGLAILQELQRNRAALETKTKQQVILNYRLFEQYESNLSEARIDNTL